MNKADLLLAVKKILGEEWDPIGVNDPGIDHDEYDGYAPNIVKLLLKGADEKKLTKHLYELAGTSMGLTTQLESHVSTARKLKELL